MLDLHLGAGAGGGGAGGGGGGGALCTESWRARSKEWNMRREPLTPT